ncbi:MAG: hypothetical protein KF878_09820 [Planctomycetes bacterium]|nr:hypothetical protein [Planctomycetota bacterium]
MLHVDTGTRTFIAGADLAEGQLVKLSGANTVNVCAAGEQPIGAVRNPVKSGAVVAIFLLSKQGTITVLAGGAIVANAPVMPINGGKVDDLATGKPIGVALSAGADNQLIEVLPLALDEIVGG